MKNGFRMDEGKREKKKRKCEIKKTEGKYEERKIILKRGKKKTCNWMR